MREKPIEILEQFRVTKGKLASTSSDGNNGAFVFNGPSGVPLVAIVSDGMGWEHVSVSLLPSKEYGAGRTPNWEEMAFVKELFWEDEETVVQYHPRKSRYVNCHDGVLHLWKMENAEYMLPPTILVGPMV